MSKNIGLGFLVVIFLSAWSSPPSNAEYEMGADVWQYLDYSFLGNAETSAKEMVLFDTAVCKNDNLGSMLCFDYGWRNNCLEVYAKFIMTDDIPYTLSPTKLPSLQVQGFDKLDLNPILELERKVNKRVLPWNIMEDRVFWRVAVGSIKKHLETKEGLVYQLLNGDRINIYFTLQNGNEMRSHATLNGIKPLLENVFKKAAAAKPEGPACK